MKQIILIVIAFIGLQTVAQTTGKIVDAQSGEPIPYANIQCNAETLISNAEGFFTIPAANSADDASLTFSYIGYSTLQMTVGDLKSRQNTVRLPAGIFELDEVKVRERPTPEAIIAAVRQNLKQNYSSATANFQTKIFMRKSNAFTPKTLNIEIDKSTGFTKNNLKGFNKELAGFTSQIINNPPKSYTDVLLKYYGSPQKKATKINVTNATKLLDENRSTSLEGMEKNATAMFLKHLDTTKYYRIKSGWFGSRDTVSLRKDFKRKKKTEPRTELTSLKTSVGQALSESSVLSKDFGFIHEPKSYEYALEGSVLLADGNFAYVLTFKPKRSRAVYVGKMYVAENDFAILRADYALAPGKKGEGLNLRLLLGVKFSENLKSGTMIYKQRPTGDGYYLQYGSSEQGQYFYVNRPLKFIELSDAEKDVVAFDFKVEGNMYEKTEYLNMSRSEISDADFDAAKETDFKYTVVKKYDPSLWKDGGAIEPLEEMKRFKASDDAQAAY